ncbi:glutaredoxin domain-containing protein [Ketobacter sp.]|uniref:glutaredoxin domain-containing protein n=1 Tax=Ketobacter sp. TaxID=2083498 RepID=UPI0025C229DE|nr:glutaredoxin domain-containing protein [Ketobacter sp.]
MNSKIVLRALVTLLCLLCSGLASAEIYKWVDDKGRVHFGDAPRKNQAVETIQLEVNTYESVSYDDVEFAEPSVRKPLNQKITMYSTSWCGYCTKARQYFTSNNIPFTEYDIEKNPSARRAYDAMGAKGVPVILVGKKRMNGFSQQGFENIYNP